MSVECEIRKLVALWKRAGVDIDGMPFSRDALGRCYFPDVSRLLDEIDRLRGIVDGLAARVVAQSELLTARAERPATEPSGAEIRALQAAFARG